MRNEYIWEVNAKNPPLLKRKCNRCDANNFYCSEKFRVNAQKRNIDIWLIYKCVKCDKTFNMNILHRTKPESIHKDVFDKFSNNNLEIVWKYAFSQEIANKNNVAFDYGSVEYDVDYDTISTENMLNIDHESIIIKINYLFDFRLKLSSVIRMCLNLSSNQLNQVIKAKIISINTKHLQKKQKVKNQLIFQVNIREIKKYLKHPLT